MKVLVVGSGGREHALCWKLAQSPRLTELYCAPGNPGIEDLAQCIDLAADDVNGLTQFAADEAIDLTIIGPEVPLTLGLADALNERGLRVFGPSKYAAQLEGSKVFAKEFMRRHEIDTANFDVVETIDEARTSVERFGLPVVLKADGLAAGKGVLIPTTTEELEEALEAFFTQRRFGASADQVIVEQCLEGEEVSLLALSDGKRLQRFVTAKDYKRIGEGDVGPNTGGMGAHSPSIVLPEKEAAEIVDQALQAVIDGLAADGHPFIGVLYAGLMLTDDGPQMLEFNVRFGDPECQPLMLRLAGDLLPVLAAAAAGDFGDEELAFNLDAAACVVLASEGYPGKPVQGQTIAGLETASAREHGVVFHSGTARGPEGQVVAVGGRVLTACASGPDLEASLERAYALADDIEWPGKVLRRDIGQRVLAAAVKNE